MGGLRRRVLKFGGTSVGSAESLRQVAAIVRRASRECWTVVVASACDGVTDQLAAAIDGVVAGAITPALVIERLRHRHEALRRALGSGRPAREAAQAVEAQLSLLETQLKALARARVATRAERDLALAAGGGACVIALRIAAEVENATIVFVVCDRGDRFLSMGVFPC